MLGSAVSESTQRKRRTAWNHWLKFVASSNKAVSILSPTELQVCLFIVYLVRKKLSFISVRTYLYSVSAEIKFRGGKQIIVPFKSWFIHSTLKAVKRLSPATEIVRRPITVTVLHALLKTLDFSDYNSLGFAAIIAVGMFGLFRVGEICYSKNKTSSKFIRNKDVIFKADHAEIKIFNTKTAPVVTKYIANIKGKWNPYALLRAFRNSKVSHRAECDPLFTLKSGKPIDRTTLVGYLRDKLGAIFPHIPKEEWNGISLRKGGATSAVRAGVSGEIIEKMGHWKSEVYKVYVDCAPFDIITAQRRFKA